MKISENWLRELVPATVDRDTLMHRLTMAGLEVEGCEVLGDGLDGIVVGHIIAADKHPDADRLQVCKVDIGASEPLQIVCGAPNARVGLKAPLATLGTHMPGGMAIKKAKLRGVASFGMLCSAREIGIDEDASGLLELPADAPVGVALADYLDLPDAAIEVSLTPNRPDCLSMHGLARDLAANLGVESGASVPAAEAVVAVTSAERDVQLEAGDGCPLYAGRIIEGVDLSATTPLWMSERLRRCGLRPLGIAVDVTNYVMLEMGQPMHAFDNDKLEGAIVVRMAQPGETLELLNGDVVELDPDFMVIADDARALAAAGIMGGMATRVTNETCNVFLEAAHFAAAAIAGKARKLGLHTDASHRFERGVDPTLPQRAMERATQLLVDVAGGKPGPVVAAMRGEIPSARPPVALRRVRLARVLGIDVPDAEVTRILTALGMQVTVTDDGWEAVAPMRRFDIEREEDLIEEVARIHGYEKVPVRMPGGQLDLTSHSETLRQPLDIAEQLVDRGYREAVNLSFLGSGVLDAWGMTATAIPLANPLNRDLAVMRTSLLPGLLEALKRNLARQQGRVRLFERGHVFTAPAMQGEAPLETSRVAWIACDSADAEQWSTAARAVDYFDLRGDVDALLQATGHPAAWTFAADRLPDWLHPGRSARVMRTGSAAGFVGMLHPALLKTLGLHVDVYVAELDLEAVCQRVIPHYEPVGKYPAVRRDIAVEMPGDVPWAAVEHCVRNALGNYLKQLHLFDCYQGEGVADGWKSLAMGLILQDESRTLADADANRWVADVVNALEQTCNARLRG